MHLITESGKDSSRPESAAHASFGLFLASGRRRFLAAFRHGCGLSFSGFTAFDGLAFTIHLTQLALAFFFDLALLGQFALAFFV
jgi:hypothetical protein